ARATGPHKTDRRVSILRVGDANMTDRPHHGACTCPACAPDLWAVGIKGAGAVPPPLPQMIAQRREQLRNEALSSKEDSVLDEGIAFLLSWPVEEFPTIGAGCAAVLAEIERLRVE